MDGPSQEEIEPGQPALEPAAEPQHASGPDAAPDASSGLTSLLAPEPPAVVQQAADDPVASSQPVPGLAQAEQPESLRDTTAYSWPAPSPPAAPQAQPPHDPRAFAWPAASEPAVPQPQPAPPHDPSAFAWPAPSQPAAPQAQPAPPPAGAYPSAPSGSTPYGQPGGQGGSAPGGYSAGAQLSHLWAAGQQPPGGYASDQAAAGYAATQSQPHQAAYPGAQVQQPPAGYANAPWQQAPPGYVPSPGGAQPYPYPPQQWGQPPQQWAQPGYGVPGAAPNAAWPGAPAPKKRRGWRIAMVAITAAVVGAAATGVVLYLNKGESPTQMALQAGRAIAPAKGLTLSGAVNGDNGTFAVTEAGTVQGTYAQLSEQVTTITVNGVTYIKAPAVFWTSEGLDGTAASQASGKWAKAPASAVIMSFAALTPGKIAGALENVGSKPRALYTTLHGTKVIKLTDQGIDYFITTSSPNRLLRVEGSSGNSNYGYNVTPLTAASIAPVYTTLHGEVQGLADAADPQANVSPSQKISFGKDCNADSSCTMTGKVAVTDHATETVLVTMTMLFSATNGGKPFASCREIAVVHTPRAATLTMTCGVHGSTWSHWFDSHSGNFTTWARASFVAAVNTTTDVKTLQSDLNQEQGS